MNLKALPTLQRQVPFGNADQEHLIDEIIRVLNQTRYTAGGMQTVVTALGGASGSGSGDSDPQGMTIPGLSPVGVPIANLGSSAVVIGDVVGWDSAGNLAQAYAGTTVLRPFGVAQTAGAIGQEVWVAMIGPVAVRVKTSETPERGDPCWLSTTAGVATTSRAATGYRIPLGQFLGGKIPGTDRANVALAMTGRAE